LHVQFCGRLHVLPDVTIRQCQLSHVPKQNDVLKAKETGKMEGFIELHGSSSI